MSSSDRRQGRLFVVSGPSGAGKGTLINRILPRLKDTYLSVSATTRPMRKGEQQGREYFFLSPEEFEECINQGDFLEHVDYSSNRYGTLRSEVEKSLGDGKNVILEVDLKGALEVRRQMPAAVLVFVAPPQFEELERRLKERNTEADDEIEARLERAREELASQDEFDYIVINESVDKAAGELEDIFIKEMEEA